MPAAAAVTTLFSLFVMPGADIAAARSARLDFRQRRFLMLLPRAVISPPIAPATAERR